MLKEFEKDFEQYKKQIKEDGLDDENEEDIGFQEF